MFFKHFASKDQLPGLSVSGTLVENGLNKFFFIPFRDEEKNESILSSFSIVTICCKLHKWTMLREV